jgi:cytochrome P450
VLTRYQDVYQVMKERAFVSSGVSEDVHAALEKESFNFPPLLWDLLHGIVLFEEGSVYRVHRQALQALFTGESLGGFNPTHLTRITFSGRRFTHGSSV